MDQLETLAKQLDLPCFLVRGEKDVNKIADAAMAKAKEEGIDVVIFDTAGRLQNDEPLVQELGRWAAMSSRHDPTLPLSPVSLMLSMRTMFDPAKAAGMQATIGFDIGGETFVARMANGALPIERADPGIAEAVFRAPGAPVLAGLLYGGVGADELERDAGLVIEGDRDLALAYADIFELPAPIA